MLIHSIQLANFLSFGASSTAVPLKPLNVIIGPNGSGKSNLLESIELLRSAPEQLSKPIRDRSLSVKAVVFAIGSGKVRRERQLLPWTL